MSNVLNNVRCILHFLRTCSIAKTLKYCTCNLKFSVFVITLVISRQRVSDGPDSSSVLHALCVCVFVSMSPRDGSNFRICFISENKEKIYINIHLKMLCF